MSKLIRLLEKMKNGEDVFDNDAFFADREFYEAKIALSPFFEEGKCTDRNLVEVLYYLYTHENIDYYPVEFFTDEVDYLRVNYSIIESKIIDLIQGFRKLIYSEI